MLEPRQGHAATELLDGRVLVTGGNQRKPDQQDDAALATTELFDPETGTWMAGPPMPGRRTNHRAIRLGDGRVLLFGGATHPWSRDALSMDGALFDPLRGTWSPIGSPHAGGFGRPMLLHDGRILVETSPLGSFDIPPPQLDLFDPARQAWTTVARGRDLRGSPMALLPDGSVLMIPAPSWGEGEGEELLTSRQAWRYDPVTDVWTELEPGPTAFDISLAATLRDGRVLLVGDSLSLLYGDPDYPWDPENSPPYISEMRLAVTLADGRVLFAGSRDCLGAVLPAQLLDPDIWGTQEVWGLPNPYGSSITLLGDGRVLVTGGVPGCPHRESAREQTADAYLLDPADIPPLDLD